MYSRDDVERLRRRTEERRAPDKAAARALQWGMPILESSIALIDGRRLYYRGLDAAMLARSRSLEEVAALIWTGRIGPIPAAASVEHRGTAEGRPFRLSPARSRCSRSPRRAIRSRWIFERPPSPRAGWRILQLLTRSATTSGFTERVGRRGTRAGMERRRAAASMSCARR